MSDATQDLPSASAIADVLGIAEDYKIGHLDAMLKIFRERGRLEGIRAARVAMSEARRG
jgi:hypothetical protein